ncbi:MAG: flavin reductase [Clostridia bacterium]|nr:flavin reductase [Clostridia bacterium]
MRITDDVFYVGVNDYDIDLFEGHYIVPEGMAYNSYLIRDEKVAVMDSVDAAFTHEWLDNISEALGGRKPDYLVVQHMEPDHSANIVNFMQAYPEATVVSSVKAFQMMKNFFGKEFEDRRIVVGEGSKLELGRHTLTFVTAPMVHWPEVIVTYDDADGILFSADGFGKFGALKKDVTDTDEEGEGWDCEARRYYFGIVGKYGAQVQALLRKAEALDIRMICPLHGPVLNKNVGYYVNKYNIWSSYGVESDGIVIAYTSVYGHTKDAVNLLADKLRAKGCPKVAVHDLARSDMAEAVEDAFRYGKIVLATTTYNAGIFPYMREFINSLTERNFCNRTVAFIENGSWAPNAAKTMKTMLEGCKNLIFAENSVKIMSAADDAAKQKIEALADELCGEYLARMDATANKNDLRALFKIGYGLYVITSRDGDKDNGFICNTVSQVTSTPNRVAVCVNKQNYSHHLIKKTGVMNVNCLSVDAPFEVFKSFGFRSGRTCDKFEGMNEPRSDNGLIFLSKYINAFMSLKVEQYVDLGTHGMFICEVTEARVISDRETMTYTYYQANVKPKPETKGKKGFVCKICGYVYEGDELPEDFICPLCKHPASDFEPLPEK